MRELPEKIDSKFRYVLLSATRAEQMMKGALPKASTAETTKPTSLGMNEIADELVAWDYGPGEAPVVEEAEMAAEATEGESVVEGG